MPPSGPLAFKDTLTAAEGRVYELLISGYTNQEMSDNLFISINTVKFHVKNILAKANVKSKYNLDEYNPRKARQHRSR